MKNLNFTQKVGRVILLTATLVVGSVLVAMLGALGLFLVEQGRQMGNVPEFYNGVAIILAGVAVNIGCVFILVQIKRADNRLVPPKR